MLVVLRVDRIDQRRDAIQPEAVAGRLHQRGLVRAALPQDLQLRPPLLGRRGCGGDAGELGIRVSARVVGGDVVAPVGGPALGGGLGPGLRLGLRLGLGL
jgi:hypothetical protein